MSSTIDRLNSEGYVILTEVYSPSEIAAITNHILSVHGDQPMFGERHFLRRTPGLLELLMNDSLRKLLADVAPDYFFIKSVYFDKPPQANLFVNWHQDKIIFVTQKIETYGFKNWTDRDGEFGVQPTAEFLGNMVTIRIHLDDATAENGAMKVIPHSHSEGPMRTTGLAFSENDGVLCEVPVGGVMLMKPLLFHCSSRTASESQRRVIHLEMCSLQLPDGLEWAQKLEF